MIHKEEVLQYGRDNATDVVVIRGAGDLDNYVTQIETILKEKCARP